jgi:hypothetical protein
MAAVWDHIRSSSSHAILLDEQMGVLQRSQGEVISQLQSLGSTLSQLSFQLASTSMSSRGSPIVNARTEVVDSPLDLKIEKFSDFLKEEKGKLELDQEKVDRFSRSIRDDTNNVDMPDRLRDIASSGWRHTLSLPRDSVEMLELSILEEASRCIGDTIKSIGPVVEAAPLFKADELIKVVSLSLSNASVSDRKAFLKKRSPSSEVFSSKDYQEMSKVSSPAKPSRFQTKYKPYSKSYSRGGSSSHASSEK